MSMLIVFLPPQPRLVAQRADAAAPLRAAAEYEYVYSADGGRQVTQHARAAVNALPASQAVVAVVPPEDVGWHRIGLPKAPASRLRAALGGVLEEALLDDEADQHLALAPDAKPGNTVWVAALGKTWLTTHLQALEAGGLTVDRVVPAWEPSDNPAGHVYQADGHAAGSGNERDGLRLAWRDAQGPVCLPLAGDAARQLVAAQTDETPVRWTASPACAGAAEALAGVTVAALSDAELALQAAGSAWNLRQFDLVAQHRGTRALRESTRRFLTAPVWRPARYGVAALIVLQLLGLNIYAWQQRRALNAQGEAMVALLRSTFPQVRAIINPLVQMEKEVDTLRASAGRPGDNDLEPMLAAANAAWPESRAPADSLKFEPGKLTLVSPGWSPEDVNGFRSRLKASGFDLEAVPGRLTLTRTRAAAPKGAA